MEILVWIIVCLYGLYLEKDDNARHVRWTQICSRKKKPKPTKKIKYGIEVPPNVVRSKDMDYKNCDTLWQYATKKEVDALI